MLICLALFYVVFIAALPHVVDTDSLGAYIKEWTEYQLGADVTMGRPSLTMSLTGRAVVTVPDIVVHNVLPEFEGDLASAGRVTVSAGMWDVLGGQIDPIVTVQGLSARAVRDVSGTINLSALRASQAPAPRPLSLWPVSRARPGTVTIRVEGGELAFQDALHGRVSKLVGLHGELTWRPAGGGLGGELAASWERPGPDEIRLSFAAELPPASGASATTASTPLRSRGTLRSEPAPVPALLDHVSGLPLSCVCSHLSVRWTTEGEQWDVSGRASLRQVASTVLGLDGDDAGMLRGRLTGEGKSIRIENLSLLRLPRATEAFSLKGVLDPGADSRASLTVHADWLDIDELARRAALPKSPTARLLAMPGSLSITARTLTAGALRFSGATAALDTGDGMVKNLLIEGSLAGGQATVRVPAWTAGKAPATVSVLVREANARTLAATFTPRLPPYARTSLTGTLEARYVLEGDEEAGPGRRVDLSVRNALFPSPADSAILQAVASVPAGLREAEAMRGRALQEEEPLAPPSRARAPMLSGTIKQVVLRRKTGQAVCAVSGSAVFDQVGDVIFSGTANQETGACELEMRIIPGDACLAGLSLSDELTETVRSLSGKGGGLQLLFEHRGGEDHVRPVYIEQVFQGWLKRRGRRENER